MLVQLYVWTISADDLTLDKDIQFILVYDIQRIIVTQRLRLSFFKQNLQQILPQIKGVDDMRY